MVQYNPANGSYTTVIPPGVAALRAAIRDVYGITRTEVVRDRARCDRGRSEHCECRAVDAFTTLRPVRRRVFVDMVRHAEALGVQSVIADRRVWGFGIERERAYTGESPHDDHIHIGMNVTAARSLTYTQAVAILRSSAGSHPTQEDDMPTPEQIAAAVWEYVVKNLVAGDEAAARRVIEWAHLDANRAAALAAATAEQLARIEAKLDALAGDK